MLLVLDSQQLKPFNCVETIAILVCQKKLVVTHFKMKLPTKYSLTNHMYIHLNAPKQMINGK